MVMALEEEDGPALVGKTLPGGWRVLRHVAVGGMGHVYEARGEDGQGQRVAVKVLHTHLMNKADVAFRFRREAEIVAMIASPHIPKLLARGRDDQGRPFQVLEFVDGVELGTILQEKVTLPYKQAVEIAIQLCKALRAAHAEGIVHRDMKPENVIVAGLPGEPVVTVLDFSVSKDEDLSFTQTGLVLGTPSYMPPEQARGEAITPLVDVYAVGAILYDMLLGRPPFEADEPGQVLAALLSGEPPKPRDLAPHLSIAAEAVLLRALAREPSARYPSIVGLMDALEKLRSEAGRQSIISTIPPPPISVEAPAVEAAPVEPEAPVLPTPEYVPRAAPARGMTTSAMIAAAVLFVVLAAALGYAVVEYLT